MYCIKINFNETIFVFMNLIYDSLYFKMYAKFKSYYRNVFKNFLE